MNKNNIKWIENINAENIDYWKTRSDLRVNAGDKTSDEIIRTMTEVYKDSLKGIQKEIQAFYGRYAAMNNLTLTEVYKRLDPKELKSVREELRKYYKSVDPDKIGPDMAKKYREQLRLQSAKSYMSRLEALKISLREELIKLGGAENVKMTDAFTRLYSNTYDTASYDLEKAIGFHSDGFYQLNPVRLERMIKERWLEQNYSDRIWANKDKLLTQLETTFLQGIARGQNANKIAESMQKNYDTAFYNCSRICRTESQHFMNQATEASYVDHNIKQYQFLADQTERTCPICLSLDKEIFPVGEEQEGINYPVMHPNCRCTTIAYYEPDEIDKLYQSQVDDENRIYDMRAGMTFKEWKKLIRN